MLKQFFQTRIASFKYAFAGWRHVIRTQRNAWIHAVATVLVMVLSFWLGLNRIEWALILVAIAIVWTAEFINTALEAGIDLITADHHPLARISKDVSAAAVLITALTSALIGFLILGPPLLEKVQGLLALIER